MIREATIKSLKGAAVELVHNMGLQGILGKLDTVYGTVASFEILMQSFYKIPQEMSDKIPAYMIQIEGDLNQIRLKYQDIKTGLVT